MNGSDPRKREVEKAHLRRRFRTYRESLSPERYERISRQIIDLALTLDPLRSAERVHTYWPLVEQREVDTRPLVAHLDSMGVEIVLPVVTDFEKDGEPLLQHVRYPGEEMLEKNRWGIYEPRGGDPVDADDVDIVIVPALGAGRNGHRIGHGRGYYDLFLAGASALRVGLVYDACLIPAVPVEPHDEPLDIVITEREIVRLRR